MKPTLDKIVAADGQTITVTTRIDADGCLRVHVFAGKDRVICAGAITAKP